MENIKNNNGWIRTNNRFVAFLDIMGFKHMVATKSHEEVYGILSTFQDISVIVDNSVDFSKYLKITIFSDSIVIFSKDDTLESFIQFLTCVNFCVLNSIVRNKIPIKGSFAHGKMTVDLEKSIFFGQPLIDSYSLQDNLFYYGAVGHCSINQYIANLDDPESRIIAFLLFKGKSCFKSIDNRTYLYANWFHLPSTYFTIKKVTEALTDLKKGVSDHVLQYVNNTLDMLLISRNERFKSVNDILNDLKDMI